MSIWMLGRKDRITKLEDGSLTEFDKAALPGTVWCIPSSIWYVQAVPLHSQFYPLINISAP